jgi:hypothetical protein
MNDTAFKLAATAVLHGKQAGKRMPLLLPLLLY